MNEKDQAELWKKLYDSLGESVDTIYQLVGDHCIDDDDVKKYLNPFFERSTALRFYVGAHIKKKG